jgi:putative redox protein
VIGAGDPLATFLVGEVRRGAAVKEVLFDGERAAEPPRRFTRFTLHFKVSGDVPNHVVERAIQLSRDKYCSVWHSLRADITLDTAFEVHPGA